jgi:hypothetical protein
MKCKDYANTNKAKLKTMQSDKLNKIMKNYTQESIKNIKCNSGSCKVNYNNVKNKLNNYNNKIVV